MALGTVEQLRNITEQSLRPLIVLPEVLTGDIVGSAWAWERYFTNKGKTPTVALADPFDQLKKYAFLESPKAIVSSIKGARDFVLIFNTERNSISDVRTERNENEIRIYLTPEKSAIDPRDFSFIPAQSRYDLMLMIGCQEKEAVGSLYSENADLFFELPIINIDTHSDNDQFGQVNFVDVVSSGVSESTALLLEELNEECDVSMAQSLLTGIVSATDSFQLRNTSPRALQVSSRLMEAGADHQVIIRYLYKTTSLNILKLWGRVMTKLQFDEKTGLVWVLVSQKDFADTETAYTDLGEILDRVKSQYGAGKIFIALFEKPDATIEGIIRTDMDEFLKKFHGLLGGKVVGSHVEFASAHTSLVAAQDAILSQLLGSRNTK